MTPEEQNEIDTLKQRLRQTELLLKQEEGKRIAVERDSYETKRQAKLTEEQAAALVTETQASLAEAAEQMKVALCVSQGIWSLGHLQKSFMARKVAAARVVFREAQMCLLMQQAFEAKDKGDQLALQTALDKMKALCETVKKDGESNRMAAVQASLGYALDGFEKAFDVLISERNAL